MPLYEYQCNDCGDEFEKMARFSEADQAQACPACQSRNTRKKILVFASLGGTSTGTSLASDSSCGSGGGYT